MEKNFNSQLDSLLSDIKLPSDQEVKDETTSLRKRISHTGKKRPGHSKKMLGRKKPEHSQNLKGKGNPNYKHGKYLPTGKTLSESKKQKIMTPKGIFDSKDEAAKAFGVAPSGISYRLKNDPKNFYTIK